MRLLWLSGAFVAGAWIANDAGGGVDLPIPVLALWAIGAFLLSSRQWVVNRPLIPALVLLLFLAGVARVEVSREALPTEIPEAFAAAGRIEFEAVLLEEPRPYGGSTRLPLKVVALDDASDAHVGSADHIKVDVLADALFGGNGSVRGFRYGDRYRVGGAFQPRSDASDYPPGISSDAVGVVTSGSLRLLDASEGDPLRRTVADLRATASASILRTVAGDESGLAVAVTTGNRAHLSARMKDDFRAAGLSHLLAISGLHVAIVAGMGLAAATFLFGRRGQLYLLVPLSGAWIYALMAGMSPSVVRASAMVAVYLLAIALGRQRSVVPAIAVAGALMAVVQPESVVSLSFQMSFAAVLGIALLEPRIRGPMDSTAGWLARESEVIGPPMIAISRGLGYSLAATAATLPLVGSSFDQVPVFGAVATVLALPAVPLLIVSSLLVAIVEPIWSTAAAPLGWISWLSAKWIVLVSRVFSDIPGATISTHGMSGWVFAGWYGVLIALLNRRVIARKGVASWGWIRLLVTEVPRWSAPTWRTVSWAIVPALVIAALPWIAVAQLPEERLTVTFFETDRGDLVLIETPEAKQVLVDGGRDADGAVRALGESLPFWDRRVDLVVLTHSDADHVGGLVDVLGRYEIGAVIDTTGSAETDVFGEWRNRLDRFDGPVVDPVAGMVIDLGSDTKLEVLWVGSSDLLDSNSSSTVVMLTHGGVRVLLTGDIPRSVEERLVNAGASIRAHVLKAAHHGSNTSSTGDFLEAVDPSLIVVPVGTRNPFGHPDDEVMDRFAHHAPGVPVLVTRDHGDVIVETDGKRMWVKTDR